MTHKALIRRLQISCLGLDRIDPLCLLVDDVVAALAQPQRTWVGLTVEEIEQMGLSNYIKVVRETEAKLKERNA
jgi:hypothetical protein